MSKFLLGFSTITSLVIVIGILVLFASALGIVRSVAVVLFILLCYGVGAVLEDL